MLKEFSVECGVFMGICFSWGPQSERGVCILFQSCSGSLHGFPRGMARSPCHFPKKRSSSVTGASFYTCTGSHWSPDALWDGSYEQTLLCSKVFLQAPSCHSGKPSIWLATARSTAKTQSTSGLRAPWRQPQ